ncbi:MAG: TlpA family protein disulfide reductase [Deltaproteobacteria bacterium]|nr:TlpA family protein disulfide reductase [Deltaproteobacteria bacterium]
MRIIFALLLISTVAVAGKAPLFNGDLLGGGRLSLKKTFEKQKGVLVCFWASWCTPCLEELKNLTDAFKSSQKPDFDVITVNVDTPDTSSDVNPTVRFYGFSFPVVLDPKQDIFAKYHQERTLPFSVLLSQTGDILQTFTGHQDDFISQIQNALSALNGSGL